MDNLASMFPAHKFGLFLSQDCHKLYHLEIPEYLKLYNLQNDWVSDEQKQTAIEKGSFWKIQWYPSNSVGSFILLAYDLDVLLEEARKII